MSFHVFPKGKNLDRLLRTVHQDGQSFQLTPHVVVCSKHFSTNAYFIGGQKRKHTTEQTQKWLKPDVLSMEFSCFPSQRCPPAESSRLSWHEGMQKRDLQTEAEANGLKLWFEISVNCVDLQCPCTDSILTECTFIDPGCLSMEGLARMSSADDEGKRPRIEWCTLRKI